jgi:cytochrome b pre-mRNA-processing protein 3
MSKREGYLHFSVHIAYGTGMFSYFRRKAIMKATAQKMYQRAVLAARAPVFYAEWGVPDTLNGRFDCIGLHVVAAMMHIDDPALRQALFDVMFRDFERSLIEMGIGDMSIGKKVKAMMRAFHGRATAYRAAFVPHLDQEALIAAIRRNVYATAPNVEDQQVWATANYMINLVQHGAAWIDDNRGNDAQVA